MLVTCRSADPNAIMSAVTNGLSSRQATQWLAVQALSRMLETDGVCKSAMIGVLAIHLVQRERLLSQMRHAPPSRTLHALQCIEAVEDAEVSLCSVRSQVILNANPSIQRKICNTWCEGLICHDGASLNGYHSKSHMS